MKKLIIILLLWVLNLLAQASLFQVTDQNGKKVLDVASNGLVILNPNTTPDAYDDTLMIITNERIKTFISSDNGKGLARSFGVVSSTTQKGTQTKVLEVNPDKTRMSDGLSGNQYTNFSPENMFIGQNAGAATNPDLYPTQNYGKRNVFIGFESGRQNIIGYQNVLIGDSTGYNTAPSTSTTQNAVRNVFIGSSSGYKNKEGDVNTFVGYMAGYSNNTNGGNAGNIGNCNTYLGGAAGRRNVDGCFNTFVGYQAGSNSGNGSNNVFLGSNAGYSETGSNKLYIANSSTATPLIKGTFPNVDLDITATNISLVGNVEIGTGTPSSNRLKVTNSQSGITGAAGYFESTNSAGIGLATFANSTDVALYAEQKNSSSTTANIAKFASAYGGWSEKMTIRSTGRIYTPDLASGTGTALQLTSGGEIVKFSSSKKYKKDIKSLSPDISTFMELNPVSFVWNEKSATENKSDYGLIAEEVEKIDKSLAVYNKDNSIEGVDYHKVNIMLLKVVQEQQKKIDDLEKRLNKLENK